MMKFHDLFLVDMKGDRFDIFLSYFVNSPTLANLQFMVTHPGKTLGSVIGGVVEVAKTGVEVAKTGVEVAKTVADVVRMSR
jgi:hypothetical protein